MGRDPGCPYRNPPYEHSELLYWLDSPRIPLAEANSDHCSDYGSVDSEVWILVCDFRDCDDCKRMESRRVGETKWWQIGMNGKRRRRKFNRKRSAPGCTPECSSKLLLWTSSPSGEIQVKSQRSFSLETIPCCQVRDLITLPSSTYWQLDR